MQLTTWTSLASNLLALSILTILSVVNADSKDIGKGWGDDINWVTLKDGLQISEKKDKPLMLVIHKSWCGACKALKPKFAASAQIRDLSELFVMVNVQDDEEPEGSQYTPDGGYIPRILFLDSSGKVITDIINKQGNDRYKYFYSDPNQIVSSMKQMLDISGPGRPGKNEL